MHAGIFPHALITGIDAAVSAASATVEPVFGPKIPDRIRVIWRAALFARTRIGPARYGGLFFGPAPAEALPRGDDIRQPLLLPYF